MSLSKSTKYEYISDPKHKRLNTTPIDENHREIWDLYDKQESIIWNSKEVKMEQDKLDFKLLDKTAQTFIKKIISFFAIFDSLVNSNISTNLKDGNKISIKEYSVFIALQEHMENVHGQTYSALVQTLIDTQKERNEINEAWKTNKYLIKLVSLARKWENSKLPIGEHIVAFAFVEGVLFSGAFASIEWVRLKGRYINNGKGKQFMQGLTQSNELIAKDEGLHVEAAVALYSLISNRLSIQKIKEIAIDFTEAAKEFMNDALTEDLIGLKKESLQLYVEHCANRLINMLGYDFVLYKKAKPLEYMINFGIAPKTNFFERSDFGYQNSETLNEKDLSMNEGKLNLVDDF